MSVTLHTTHGDIKVQLYCEQAPMAAKNFLGLAAAEKYNNISFHRLMKSFLMQGGNTNGKGGETIYEKPFPCEFHPNLSHSKRGILGMATKPSDPNANLSQFYIIFAAQEYLDKTNTVFGCVIDGWDVIDTIEGLEVDAKYKPTTPVTIQTITIHANPFALQEDWVPCVTMFRHYHHVYNGKMSSLHTIHHRSIQRTRQQQRGANTFIRLFEICIVEECGLILHCTARVDSSPAADMCCILDICMRILSQRWEKGQMIKVGRRSDERVVAVPL